MYVLSMFFFENAYSQVYHAQSPNGQNVIQFELSNGKPVYSIERNGQAIINTSSLGFILSDEDFLDSDYIIESTQTHSKDTTWHPIWGETNTIREHYNALLIRLKHKSSKLQLNIEFKVFDDGIGFRYHFPEQKRFIEIIIHDELTEFCLSENYNSWWIPDDADTYEHLYQNTPLSELKACNTPVTLERIDGACYSIHEANLTSFPDMMLENLGDNTLKAKLVSSPEGYAARIRTPFSSPWRTLILADSAADLITSNLVTNLNEPCKFNNTDWIRPMKYIGIWWGMHIGRETWEEGPKHGATTENAKQYIDFAADNNIQAVLFEGWNKGWDTWHTDKNIQNFIEPASDFDLTEVARYAQEKGVEIIGHHETGGNIPEYENQLDSAFKLYKSLGIDVVKTGYAGRIYPEGNHKHGQMMVEHYRKVLETAARYEIMIDAHEPIKATGLRRTYPNMMTREGARGMEWNAWSEGNPPEHTVVLPFTRCLGGPLDYTPGIFNIQFSGYRMGTRVHTTLARQLALMLTLYSPLQMASDLIENYDNHPAFKFIKDVPVTWDETKVLNAKIGDYFTITRRKSDDWYLASTTDENFRHFEIPLSFLDTDKKYIAEIFADAITTDWDKNPAGIDICQVIVSSLDTLPVVLSNNGGTAIRFTPYKGGSYDDLSDLRSLVPYKLKTYSGIPIHGKLKTTKHHGMHTQLNLKYQPDGDYTADGPTTLLDGILGKEWDYSKHWLGFKGKNFEAVIDMGEIINIENIRTGFLRNQVSWIFLPKSVIYEVSSDGVNFEPVLEQSFIAEKNANGNMIKDVIASNINKKARYIKIKADALKNCPEWHYGFGNSSWLFADEIMINFAPNYFDQVDKGVFFDKKKYTAETIPTFDEVKSAIPEPVLEDQTITDMYWFCWELAFNKLKKPDQNSPFVSNYIDEAFNPNLFQWDTHFMILFWKYAHHLFNAVESHDNFYRSQHENGYICREIKEADGRDQHFGNFDNTINPPLFAWVELETFRMTKDTNRLKEVFVPLCKYAEWLELNKKHPGTLHNLFWQTNLGSGMDNSPRYGSGWVDMSAQMALHYQSMAEISQIINLQKKVELFETRATEISSLINSWMWDEDDGFYYDVDNQGNKNKVKTVAAFWTLLAGIPDQKQAESLISHLDDTNTFNRPVLFPTLAADHPDYHKKGNYWHGGVWAPTNYMIIKGLEKYGYYDKANEYSTCYLEVMKKIFKETGTVWENYAPESIEPGNISKPDFVGWTGLGPIALLTEDIIGIHTDALQQKIFWNITRNDKHGVKNLMLGDNRITLIFIPEKQHVQIKASNAFILQTRFQGKKSEHKIKRGISTISL